MTDTREPEGIYIAYWDPDELAANGIRMPPHIKGMGPVETEIAADAMRF